MNSVLASGGMIFSTITGGHISCARSARRERATPILRANNIGIRQIVDDEKAAKAH
jgi:hypothetical protein